MKIHRFTKNAKLEYSETNECISFTKRRQVNFVVDKMYKRLMTIRQSSTSAPKKANASENDFLAFQSLS